MRTMPRKSDGKANISRTTVVGLTPRLECLYWLLQTIVLSSSVFLKPLPPPTRGRPIPLKVTLQGESLPTLGGYAIQVVALRSTDDRWREH